MVKLSNIPGQRAFCSFLLITYIPDIPRDSHAFVLQNSKSVIFSVPHVRDHFSLV